VGHFRLGKFPRSQEWQDVVALIAGHASAGQVAVAAVLAAETGLAAAARDAGVVATVHLLLRLPIAARQESFPAALDGFGVRVSDDPSLMEVIGAVSDAIDAALPNNRGRTDLGEMAQTAAAETLAAAVGPTARSMFGAAAEDVRAAVAELATVKRFGLFARMFFGRFTYKVLDYYLSRALADQVGEGRRFTTLGQQAEFSTALETYCKEAARYVDEFSGEWASKAKYAGGGDVPRDRVPPFVGGAMKKLLKEFKRGVIDHG
jgi:hypothetical protein